MLLYERQLRSVIFFRQCYRKWAPLEKRKEERRMRVVGFRGARREERPKCALASPSTCRHAWNLQGLSSPHLQLYLKPSILEALFSKVKKREQAREERWGGRASLEEKCCVRAWVWVMTFTCGPGLSPFFHTLSLLHFSVLCLHTVWFSSLWPSHSSNCSLSVIPRWWQTIVLWHLFSLPSLSFTR